MTEFYKPIQVFAQDEAERIIQQALLGEWRPGGIKGVNHGVRTNWITWHEQDDLYGRFLDLLSIDPRLPVDWIQTPYQVSRYQGDEHYAWHRDTNGPHSRRTSVRSVTLTITLRSTGTGRFEVGDRVYDLKPGWGVVFPSNDLHRATSAGAGERYSFTVWGMRYNPNRVS